MILFLCILANCEEIIAKTCAEQIQKHIIVRSLLFAEYVFYVFTLLKDNLMGCYSSFANNNLKLLTMYSDREVSWTYLYLFCFRLTSLKQTLILLLQSFDEIGKRIERVNDNGKKIFECIVNY